MSTFKDFQLWAIEKGHYATVASCESYTMLLDNRKNSMNEQAIQAKILAFLADKGFITIKTIVTNKAGTGDIIACDPRGKYWEIEVKTPTGKASKLQEVRIKKLQKQGAVAFIAYGYDDFLEKFDHCPVI